ncbi:MAG: rod shape-determining protein MreC [Parachlamydiaceae bacterium]|nr:rod shape-determining protein MreC [Parachlamydiaceae bacterium]
MRKKIFSTYFLIAVILLLMMSVSRFGVDQIRSFVTSLSMPIWENLLSAKYFILHPTQPSPFHSFSSDEELQKLAAENQLLTNELAYLNLFIDEHLRISSEMSQEYEEGFFENENRKSLEKSISLLKWRINAIPARVIFRTFDTWNHFFWINIGETFNENQTEPLIGKNSPVVIGRSIVGVVDFVGKTQSRVRLISDPQLKISVRAARGGENDLRLKDSVDYVLEYLERRNQSPLLTDSQIELNQSLAQLQEQLYAPKKTKYLAKGEMQGCPSFAKRGANIFLKGVGFNYDFPDENGDWGDLRTGKTFNHFSENNIPIIKPNDILITTGMDGIFPSGFQVGTVTHVDLLKEGDYYFTIQAKPSVSFLEELSLVYVLPPHPHESF